MKKKRVLYLAHIEPFPASSGDRVRLGQQLQRLVEEFTVDAVVISHSQNASLIKDFIPNLRDEKRFYFPPLKRYLRASNTILNLKPLAVNHFFHKEVADYVGKVANNYDMIFCASPVMAQYVMRMNHRLKGIIKLLDATDSLSMNYMRESKRAKFPLNILFKADSSRMKKYEKRFLKEFDRIAYISDIDRNFIPDFPQKKFIVSNSVKLPPLSECNQHSISYGHPVLSFVGMMSYLPNIYAMKFFISRVFPWILQKYPDTLLRIVGGNPAEEIRRLASGNIEVTGFVDDLTPVFRDCTAFVAPLLTGSGVQNKILQAMAHKACVVTTRFGAEGLDTGNGLIVCNEPEQMAQQICELIENPRKCSLTGEAARQYVADNFSEEKVKQEFNMFTHGN